MVEETTSAFNCRWRVGLYQTPQNWRISQASSKIAIIQWVSEQGVGRSYYYQISVLVEPKSWPWHLALFLMTSIPLLWASKVIGILCTGISSRARFLPLKNTKNPGLYRQRYPLLTGLPVLLLTLHCCETSCGPFSVKVWTVSEFSQVSEENNPIRKKIIQDKRLENFKDITLAMESTMRRTYLSGSFTAQSGYDLTRRPFTSLGDQLPPSAFCSFLAWCLAIGALRTFVSVGIKSDQAPRWVSFLLTTLVWPSRSIPPLSSITVHTEEMGRAGMDILNKEVLHGRKNP